MQVTPASSCTMPTCWPNRWGWVKSNPFWGWFRSVTGGQFYPGKGPGEKTECGMGKTHHCPGGHRESRAYDLWGPGTIHEIQPIAWGWFRVLPAASFTPRSSSLPTRVRRLLGNVRFIWGFEVCGVKQPAERLLQRSYGIVNGLPGGLRPQKPAEPSAVTVWTPRTSNRGALGKAVGSWDGGIQPPVVTPSRMMH